MAPRKAADAKDQNEVQNESATVELNGGSLDQVVVPEAVQPQDPPAESDGDDKVADPATDPELSPEEQELADQEQAKRAAIIGAVGHNEPQDAVIEPTEVPTPTRAGTVAVKVTADGFTWLDSDGFHQSALKGETVKVSAAQADRGVDLGAVERV